jgi:hypothetical protein
METGFQYLFIYLILAREKKQQTKQFYLRMSRTTKIGLIKGKNRKYFPKSFLA